MSVLLTCRVVCVECKEIKTKAIETGFLSPDEGILEKTFLEMFRREGWEMTQKGSLCDKCITKYA